MNQIKKDIIDLNKEFLKVKEKGWIKNTEGYKNANGIIFEQMIHKVIENFEIPDYNHIEIKTHQFKSNSYVTLFNATPDGELFFEIQRLVDSYGYPDSKIQKKVFQGDVWATKRNYIGSHYNFILQANDDEERLYLCIFDISGHLIEKKIYWEYNTLKEKLYRKLNYLAYIEVDKKIVHKEIYYRYTNIIFYQLKSFENFIEAIKKGYININFKIGRFHSGKRIGEIHDHGTSFRIKESNLNKIFNKITLCTRL